MNTFQILWIQFYNSYLREDFYIPPPTDGGYVQVVGGHWSTAALKAAQ